MNDDYVKFIAFAESMIEKTSEGIVGFITNHGYLDNPTFRGMRWHLMQTFDEIYALDLHGNSKKKEKAPDGGKDENVFAIQQGVAIMLAIKTGKKKKGALAKVYRFDIWGKQESKFNQLDKLSIQNTHWTHIEARFPNLPFTQGGSLEFEREYQKGFSVVELFPKNTTGIVTMGDSFIIGDNKEVLSKRIDDFLENNISEAELKHKYNLGKNYAKWVIDNKKKIENDFSKVVPLDYRPFDTRYTYFDNNLVWRTRTDIMEHLINRDNLSLITPRQSSYDWAHVFLSSKMSEFNLISTAAKNGSGNVFPLYLYTKNGLKIPNFKKIIIDEIEKIVGKVSPEDVFDYIYVTLHSPSYREKYKEFLKIDFPRVPYPKDNKQFASLVVLGRELRELHLLESPKVNKFITSYPNDGSNVVERVEYKDGNVYINKNQYFGSVPEVAWSFWIGGYQPAQKWLKDRKGRPLTNTDIEHYQKIIVVLVETEKLMTKIDEVLENGLV